MPEERYDNASLASLTSISHLSHREYLEEVKRVDHHFRLNAYFVAVTWVLLILWSYWVTPPEEMEILDGPEFYAALFATMFMLLTMVGRFSGFFWLETKGSGNVSGVLVASLTTQIISCLNNALMCCGIPIPVRRDPIMGTRLFLIRWCGWVPLGYYMTLLVTGIDPGTKLENAYMLALSQGISTASGLLIPMCTQLWQWVLLMFFAFVLFGFMFPALYFQKASFSKMRRGSSAHSMELWDRSRLGYQLMLTCTVAWTSLVVMYFFAGAAAYLRPKDALFSDLWVHQRPYFSMIWECVMDVILKNLYMNIIVQVHKVAFDDGERAERRLAELRRLMSAVWERSSDVICVSVQGIGGSITTMVSPVYLELYHCRKESNAILFEIEKEDIDSQHYSNVPPRSVREIDFRSLPAPGSHVFTDFGDDMDIGTLNSSLDESLLTSLAGMIARGWSLIGDQKSLNHRLLKIHEGEKKFTSCEANICRLENDAMLMVIRDISERAKRFEAEKKMVFETTARKKDAEANRFTRHEVKNGLLAAIHLCDSLKDTTMAGGGGDDASRDPTTPGTVTRSAGVVRTASAQQGPAEPRAEISAYTRELDKTLRNILDTILSEAMARDVIHGNYEPKMERVELAALLTAREMRSDRFRLNTSPSPLPSLFIDPQLLLYIHRNAMSNACKYGLMDGIVTTDIFYDESMEVLRIHVVNLPGPEHERLLELGDEASIQVFEPGRRLHNEGSARVRQGSHSAGDGAWIIRKCAETLRGKAAIRFEQGQTVFSLECPAKRFGQRAIQSEIFQIPSNAWGVAIDDSKIQRKLLSKFLSHAGVAESRQIIQGSTAQEIRAFDSFLVNLVERNSNDYFLVVVDENLDITENGTLRSTVSGSECIQRVRQRLNPEHERRILGLVRSANDSSQDIATYLSRAHGFVSKAPVRSSAVVETIAPLWEKRFNYLPMAVKVTGHAAMPEANSDFQGMSDFVSLVVKELQANLDAVDELSSEESNASLIQNWPLIWEKLHCLKGDLSSLFNTPSILKAVSDINDMRGPDLPPRFVGRWTTLRSQISDIASTIGSRFPEDEAKKPRSRKRSYSNTSLDVERKKQRS